MNLAELHQKIVELEESAQKNAIGLATLRHELEGGLTTTLTFATAVPPPRAAAPKNGNGPRRRRMRTGWKMPEEGMSIRALAVRVLKGTGQPMNVDAIARGILAAGYAGAGPTTFASVGATLAVMAKRREINRVEKGVYEAK